MIAEAEPTTTLTLSLDGVEVSFAEGETISEIAERKGREVPTLCYDPRLEAFPDIEKRVLRYSQVSHNYGEGLQYTFLHLAGEEEEGKGERDGG
mgnify:CR=1 FL=1